MTIFMLTLWCYTRSTSHIPNPKGTALLLGLLLSWAFQLDLVSHLSTSTKQEVTRTLWCFWPFFGNFPSPWIIWIKLSNGLQLTEGKNLEDFWVDTFPVLFLASCAARLGYVSLREQNLRPGKKHFLIAVCCSINVHSFQKTWFLWNPSRLVWFGPEIWWPATLSFENHLISVISWIHGETGKPFYLPLLLREPWRSSWVGFFIHLEYTVKTVIGSYHQPVQMCPTVCATVSQSMGAFTG